MSSTERPRPRPSVASRQYWEAIHEHRLLLEHCTICHRIQYHPRGFCTSCLQADVDWITASGTGHVHSFTIVRKTPHRYFNSLLPYVLAIVELDEGVRVLTDLHTPEPSSIEIGMRVRAVYSDIDDGVTVLDFEPWNETKHV